MRGGRASETCQSLRIPSRSEWHGLPVESIIITRPVSTRASPFRSHPLHPPAHQGLGWREREWDWVTIPATFVKGIIPTGWKVEGEMSGCLGRSTSKPICGRADVDWRRWGDSKSDILQSLTNSPWGSVLVKRFFVRNAFLIDSYVDCIISHIWHLFESIDLFVVIVFDNETPGCHPNCLINCRL